MKGWNNKVGSRPPVYFVKYAEVSATLPGVAETAVTQQYLLNHTPALTGIQLGVQGPPGPVPPFPAKLISAMLDSKRRHKEILHE